MEAKDKGLSAILNEHFGWNKARMACFVGMLLALIKVRTVNLVELSCGFESVAKLSSRYQRLKRFFGEFTIDLSAVAIWMVRLFELDDDTLYISMDRTNWRWGRKDINIFMLSIVYKGIALPLVWTLLSKRGNSNTQERIEMMKQLFALLGKQRIAGILADREFVGREWFSWLKQEQVAFCIRIKKNTLTLNRHGKAVNVSSLFRDLKVDEQRVLSGTHMIWKAPVYLSALRLSDDDLLIVATDFMLKDPIAHYAKRWQIETLFGCFKSKGFNFEDTHMVQPERISKLIALLAMAFAWAHKVGEWRNEIEPILIKKHGRKAQSWFRYGLDYLRELLLNPSLRSQQAFNSMIELLT